MNDDAFALLIAEDVKNTATPSQREYLALESNLHRWKRGLLALAENLNQQIASLDADQQDDMQRYVAMGKDGEKLLGQSIEHYTLKIAKIKRFKFHVEKKLNEVNSCLENSGTENASFADFLKAAILKHKELIIKFELDPTEIDEALWAAVDNVWNFDNALSRMHETDGLYAS